MGNTINHWLNDKVVAMQQWLQANRFSGQRDIIVAYSSLTVLYDPVQVKPMVKQHDTVFNWVKEYLELAFAQSTLRETMVTTPVRIPVLYGGQAGPDMAALCLQKNMSEAELVQLHTSEVYRVYSIGFLPGFSYMAGIPEKLVTPRKPEPVPVPAGSVGIAGEQTGIYPLNSPGGWHIIGRTPLSLFNPGWPQLVFLKVGDQVQFYPIDQHAYDALLQQTTTSHA